MPRRQSKDPLERYGTPAWCTRALFEKSHIPAQGTFIVEPCAGDGAMTRVIESYGHVVRSFDIAPRHPDVKPGDVTAWDFWIRNYRGEPIITNPAFSIASALLRSGLAHGANYIALLLRLSWLESTKDRQDLPDPQGLIVLPRPKFIESPEARAIREAAGKKWGGDSVTCAWMIWGVPSFIIRVTQAEKKAYERHHVVQTL